MQTTKRPKALANNSGRLPTVEECENCKYQYDCQAGRFCTKAGKGAKIHHKRNRVK